MTSPAVSGLADTDGLREALADALRGKQWIRKIMDDGCPSMLQADEFDLAAAVLPVVQDYARRVAAEAVAPFEELFANGPDTSCRTTWHAGGAGAVECVEVPMADLRDAFAHAAALAAADSSEGGGRR